MPSIFLEKTEVLEVKDYRAALPCDFHEMIQVRTGGQKCDTYYGGAMRYSTDNFHMSE